VTYEQFLLQKEIRYKPCGFDATEDNQKLFQWQSDIVRWAVKKGRAAIFADCGLGKSAMQLQWADQVSKHENKPVLICAPLAVAAQTKLEGLKFDIKTTICRKQEDVKPGINITNYEMLDYFDPGSFCGVVLDESSILKAYTGVTKRKIISMFENTKYKLSCSATPAPNDLMELLNQSDFLGVMKSNEALACWFIADQRDSGHYRLKGHAANSFWRWVSSWAVCIETPADIDYPDDMYHLQPLNERVEVVGTVKDGLEEFTSISHSLNMSATGFHKEKQRTVKERAARCAEIANSTDEQCIIWCYRNDEADELRKLLPDAVEVRGSDKVEKKEQAAVDFAQGKIKTLISKPSIFGLGLNFQSCHKMVFCGLDYSFESYYQAVRRVYRFGQTHAVEVVKVIGENEQTILDTVERKEEMKKTMRISMAAAMKEFQTGEVHGRRFKLEISKEKVNFPDWLRSETA
jgi:superfamily II DNA or RNA helicase